MVNVKPVTDLTEIYDHPVFEEQFQDPLKSVSDRYQYDKEIDTADSSIFKVVQGFI